jgi:hypothetical protein
MPICKKLKKKRAQQGATMDVEISYFWKEITTCDNLKISCLFFCSKSITCTSNQKTKTIKQNPFPRANGK